MAGKKFSWLKTKKFARNGWIKLGKPGNVWKWLEMAGTGGKWIDMAGNNWKWLEKGCFRPENGWEMAGN